ncbi:Defective in cullin neddylation protein 1 [Exophiala dermatitidis]
MPNKRKSTEALPPASDQPKDKKAKMAPASNPTNLAASVSTAFTSVVGGLTATLPSRAKASKKSAKVQRAKPSGFYQSGSGNSTVSPIQQNLSKLFDQYRDNPKDAPDKIGIEGAQKYLTDLNVELDEVAHLAICDLLQCPSIGEFERDSFISGWRSVSIGDKPYDTISRQSQYVNTIRKRVVTDPAYFKQVYRNAFKLAKPEGQRSVPMDSAIDFWNMFFREGKGGIKWNTSTTKWLDLWCEFYETKNKRPVNKDLWNMVCELVFKTKEPGGETLEWWTEDGAWPMAVDDFVAYVKDKRSAQTDSMDIS